jgi:dihydrofolate synthase/folylpolyglutamate synthase
VDLAAWLERLEQLHPSAIDLGLSRCGEVARRLDLLETPATTVTVAGTNGKGSTVAVMEAVLCTSGQRVGAFTSPHLIRYNERIRIDGQEASDELIVEAFRAIEQARAEISLTYFEFNTLAALWIFKKLEVTFQLLEVGLGGRLDAVNIIDSDVAVITAVGLDHQEWLGDDIETIAVEKAGIARRGRPCIVADAGGPASVYAELQRCGAKAVLATRDYRYDETHFHGVAAGPIPWSLPMGLIPLNAAAGLSALEAAGITMRTDSVSEAMTRLVLQGRRECRRLGDIDVVLDVAHNPDAAEQLRQFLEMEPRNRPTAALFAVMSDKNCRDMINAVEHLIDEWYLPAGIGGERGQSPKRLAGFISGVVHVELSFKDAFDKAVASLEPGGRLIVFGSFFTVGEGMKAIEYEQSVRVDGQS